MALRRLRLWVIEPSFRVNLCGIVCGKPVAASVEMPLSLLVQGVAGIVLDDGGSARNPADGAVFLIFMGIYALVG
jgi:hypothetical protein